MCGKRPLLTLSKGKSPRRWRRIYCCGWFWKVGSPAAAADRDWLLLATLFKEHLRLVIIFETLITFQLRTTILTFNVIVQWRATDKGQHSQFFMFFNFHSAQNKCHINHSRSLQKLLHNCHLFTAAVAKVIVARAWATFWAQTWTPTHLRWEKVQPRLFLKVFELELIYLSYFCELSKSVLLLAVIEVRLNTWDYCIHGR